MKKRVVAGFFIICLVVISGMLNISSVSASNTNDLLQKINEASTYTILKSEIQNTSNGITCNSYCEKFYQKCIMGYVNIENDVLNNNVFTQRDGIVSCGITNGPANVKYLQCMCSYENGLDNDGKDTLGMLNSCEVMEKLGTDLEKTDNGLTCDSVGGSSSCILGYRDITNDVTDMTTNTQRDGIVSCDITNGPANVRDIKCLICSSSSAKNKSLADEILNKINSADMIEVKKAEMEKTSNGITCNSICENRNKICLWGYRDIANDNVDSNVQTQRDGIVSCDISNGPANINYLFCSCANKDIVSNDQFCSDSDGGRDYYTYGETTGYTPGVGGIYTSKDMCLQDGVNNADLQETWCENSMVKVERFNCPNGCLNGACIEGISNVTIVVPTNNSIGANESNLSIIVTPDNQSKPVDIPLQNNSEVSYICNGCESGSKCYPYGFRINGNFCSDKDNKFITQLESDDSCQNSFECGSNLCVNNQCVSGSLWQKILDWFSKLFGGK